MENVIGCDNKNAQINNKIVLRQVGMKRIQAFQEYFVDIGNAFRAIQDDISVLQSDAKVNAVVLDRLSQQVSCLERKADELQKTSISHIYTAFFGFIALVVAIVGVQFIANEWRMDSRISIEKQHTQKLIEDSIRKHEQIRSKK